MPQTEPMHHRTGSLRLNPQPTSTLDRDRVRFRLRLREVGFGRSELWAGIALVGRHAASHSVSETTNSRMAARGFRRPIVL